MSIFFFKYEYGDKTILSKYFLAQSEILKENMSLEGLKLKNVKFYPFFLKKQAKM